MFQEVWGLSKILVEPGVVPRFIPARSVLYAFRDKVDRELQRLQDMPISNYPWKSSPGSMSSFTLTATGIFQRVIESLLQGVDEVVVYYDEILTLKVYIRSSLGKHLQKDTASSAIICGSGKFVE